MNRRTTTLLLLSVSLCGPLFAQASDPGWLLVAGSDSGYGGASVQRIAELYLRQATWRIVAADQAALSPTTHRFLIGTPADNLAIAACLPDLGVIADPEKLRYRGHTLEKATGLAVVTDDPDGAGRLVLFTGIDADGVAACLSVPIDLGRPGVTIAKTGHVLHRGSDTVTFDTSAVLVVRLDRDFDHLCQSVAGAARSDVALRLARGLAGYDFVHEAAFHSGVEMLPLMRQVIDNTAAITAARDRFAGTDLTALIEAVHARCERLLGPHRRPQPVYYLLYGHPHGTNASNFDDDPDTGRRRVMLNLCRLRDSADFETVALHETVHTHQRDFGRRLVERAIVEGVATLLTQELRPDTTDAEALMWSDAQLHAAQAHRAELISAFRHHADATDESTCGRFLRADSRIPELPETPPRCGYYVGWLAAKAWRAAHPNATAKGLLEADADAVLAALR